MPSFLSLFYYLVKLEMEFGKGALAEVKAKRELNERAKLHVFQDGNDELDSYL